MKQRPRRTDAGCARRLVRHHSGFHIRRAHPHPIFSPDDRRVVYTSDASGHCNVYMARVEAEN
jgi:Tol biopolymer transport system component